MSSELVYICIKYKLGYDFKDSVVWAIESNGLYVTSLNGSLYLIYL